MNSTGHNLSLAEAMLAEMEEYLTSKSLFWPLEHRAPLGAPAYPRLTIGGLCLTLDELEAQRDEMAATELKRYSGLKGAFNSLQREWAVALETKIIRETGSRLNLWQAYVQDIEASEAVEWGYRTEVRQRVMLARLMELMRTEPELDELRETVLELDRRLRPRFSAGEFVWDEKLTAIYPRARFWYLYGKPRQKL